MILVSACLLGLRTKYDGDSNVNELLLKYSHLGRFIPVCPEQLGGLTTPREPAEIQRGTGKDVLKGISLITTKNGKNFTEQFVRGAEEVVAMKEIFPITAAILKERSPSCGVHFIYTGSFERVLVPGEGVTTAALKEKGIPVFSEEVLTAEVLESLLDLSYTGKN